MNLKSLALTVVGVVAGAWLYQNYGPSKFGL
jgi:hypothetical protein